MFLQNKQIFKCFLINLKHFNFCNQITALTFADGTLETASFDQPLKIQQHNNILYVLEKSNKIRIINQEQVSTLNFQIKYKITDFLIIGNQLYFIDESTHKLRVIDLVKKRVTCLLGNGRGFRDGDQSKALLNQPTSMCLYDQKSILITDKNGLRLYSILNKKLSTILQYANQQNSNEITNLYDLKIQYCSKIIVDKYFQDTIYLCDKEANVVYQCDLKHKKVKVIAGIVNLANKQLNTLQKPQSICQCQYGIVIADTLNNQIKLIKQAGIIQLLSNELPGYVDGEQFSVMKPTDLLAVNDKILIVDSGNNVIRLIEMTMNQQQVEQVQKVLEQSQSSSSSLYDTYSQYLRKSSKIDKTSIIFTTQVAIPEKQTLSVVPIEQTQTQPNTEISNKQELQNEDMSVDQLLNEGYTQTLTAQAIQNEGSEIVQFNLDELKKYSQLLQLGDFDQVVNDTVEILQLNNSIGDVANQTEEQTIYYLSTNYNQFILAKLEDCSDMVFTYPLDVNKQRNNQFISIDQAENYQLTLNIFSKQPMQEQQCFVNGNKVEYQTDSTDDLQNICKNLQYYKYNCVLNIASHQIKDNQIILMVNQVFYKIQLKQEPCQQVQQNLLRYYYIAAE